MLLARALQGRRREDAVISVKFGALRGPDGRVAGVDGRPVAVKTFLAYSLRRLGTDYVDIYRPARVDPAVPIEDTVGAIAELVQAGYVRHPGCRKPARRPSAARTRCTRCPTCRSSTRCCPVGSRRRSSPPAGSWESGHRLRRPVPRSSRWPLADRPRARPQRLRTSAPRFSADNLGTNLALVDALRTVALAREATVAQVAVAWVAAQGEDIVPLVGAKRPDQLAEAVAALDIRLGLRTWPTSSGPCRPTPSPGSGTTSTGWPRWTASAADRRRPPGRRAPFPSSSTSVSAVSAIRTSRRAASGAVLVASDSAGPEPPGCAVAGPELRAPGSRCPTPLDRHSAARTAAAGGTPCSQSRWARPPSTSRSPGPGARSTGCAPLSRTRGVSTHGRRAPKVRIATRVFSVYRSSRSRCAPRASRPSR